MGMGHKGCGGQPWNMTQSTLEHNAQLCQQMKIHGPQQQCLAETLPVSMSDDPICLTELATRRRKVDIYSVTVSTI